MKRIALFFLLMLNVGLAAAQYPNRPIRIVLPFGPGSATDAVMRAVAPAVSASIGQPILIDHKPGADGAVSASEVARAAPDGYTLGVGSGGPLAAVPALRKNPPYDVKKDFTPITDIGRYTVFLFVNADVPAKTFAEFVAHVKANPGKVAYGTGNPSGIVAWAQLNSLVGLDMLHVPYKSAPQVMPDLLTNRVQALMDPPTVALAHVKDGKLRALATTLTRRSPLLPDVPTLEESGVKESNVQSWQAVAGPRGMPAELKSRIHAAIAAAVADPAIRARLLDLGFEIVASTPEQFSAFQAAEYARWQKLISSRGIKAD